MKKNIYTYILFIFPIWVSAQNVEIDNDFAEKEVVRDPITFTHQPFLLIKFSPIALFQNDNTLMFGAEIAPPFGKFSFNFDYGIGSNKWSLNKFARDNFEDSKTKIFRAEIRTYFSDWIPFYSLDKKPFGRYYAVELSNKTVERTQAVAVGIGGVGFPSYVSYQKVPIKVVEQAIHFKFGRHFLINRFLFLDGFVGIGPGRYDVSTTDTSILPENVLHYNYTLNRKNWLLGTNGLFLSKTAGLRVCFVL